MAFLHGERCSEMKIGIVECFESSKDIRFRQSPMNVQEGLEHSDGLKAIHSFLALRFFIQDLFPMP